MRTRTFSEEEKVELKQKMMEAGIPILQDCGMKHMSVTKLTAAVGIGKSTFYNFFDSKEEFVDEMLHMHRKKIMEKFHNGIPEGERYSKEQSVAYVRTMLKKMTEFYGQFSQEDEQSLYDNDKSHGRNPLDLNKERAIMESIFSRMEGVREKPEYAVISNMIKILVFANEQKSMLHSTGYEATRDCMIEVIIHLIFEEEI